MHEAQQQLQPGQKRKGAKTFQDTFAKVLLQDATLSAFAVEVGLLDNGELMNIGDAPVELDEETMDEQKSIKIIAQRTLSVIQAKKNTSYIEVADDVSDLHQNSRVLTPELRAELKELRKRVYDVLNVLVSLGVVRKEKQKKVRWFGIPYGSPTEVEMQAYERGELLARIEAKEQRIRELLIHQLALRNLQSRLETQPRIPENERLALPFVAISTTASGTVECEISEDHSQVCLTFSSPFEIRDDNEILRMLKYHEVSASLVKEVVPPELYPYLPESLQPASGNVMNMPPHLLASMSSSHPVTSAVGFKEFNAHPTTTTTSTSTNTT